MQLTFPDSVICKPSISSSCPIWAKVILEAASLRTCFLPNLSFLLTPAQTQIVGCFPFLSPHCWLFLRYMHLSIRLGLILAVLQAANSQPSARLAPEPTPTSNTPSFHHCPPSVMTASSGWSSESCYCQVCTKSQAGVSSPLCHGADVFSCLLPVHAKAP